MAIMLKCLLKLPPRLALHAYFYFRQLGLIRSFLNRESRRVYKNYPLSLDFAQEKIASDFKNNGIAITHLDQLFPGQNILKTLQEYTDNCRQQAQVGGVKKFLDYLWDNFPSLDFNNNPFLEGIALHPRVLAIVNNYLGMCGQLLHFTLNVTRVVDKRTMPVQSQKWHRDPEDRQMCKVFVYLTDVDEGSGPFVYLPQSNCGSKFWKLFPMRPPVGNYPPEGAMEKLFPVGDLKTCVGRAGTVIFADTAGLHRGGYATNKERVMFTASYCPFTCPSPYMYSLPNNLSYWLKNKSPSIAYAIRDKVPGAACYWYDLYKRVISW